MVTEHMLMIAERIDNAILFAGLKAKRAAFIRNRFNEQNRLRRMQQVCEAKYAIEPNDRKAERYLKLLQAIRGRYYEIAEEMAA